MLMTSGWRVVQMMLSVIGRSAQLKKNAAVVLVRGTILRYFQNIFKTTSRLFLKFYYDVTCRRRLCPFLKHL